MTATLSNTAEHVRRKWQEDHGRTVSVFGSGLFGGGAQFADEGFHPEYLPEPGPFLETGTTLTGTEHAAVHETARELFEERGVYDMTFGYNLAELNRDTRHPDAGFRYAEDDDCLRAEFTPTTEFCPQTDTLTLGAFRAWNGRSDRHDYDVVSVRAAPSHHDSDRINDRLAALEATFRETGQLRLPESE